MRELSDVEREVLVSMSTDAASTFASADVAALIGVSAALAESALWALVDEDLAEEVAQLDNRHAGRWSAFRITPYGIRLGHLLAREAAS